MLSGTIAEDGAQDVPRNARVSVVEGANAGKSADANAEGRYTLGDLEGGTFSLRATADALESETRSVTLAQNATADFRLKRVAAPGPPKPRVEGRAIDTLNDTPLGGVTIKVEGGAETTTSGDGAFVIEASDAAQVHAVTLSAPSIVTRTTRLRVPGPAATLSLIPASFDLTAYDQMFRATEGQLHRWTSAPPIVVVSRVLKFTNTDDAEYEALAGVMTDRDVEDLLADLRWALPQLTGNAFHAFAAEERERPAEGARVSVVRPGIIVVARYDGLRNVLGYWGYTRWAWNAAGEIRAGIMMIDSEFDAAGGPYRRSLRAHEFGHALGNRHVDARPSFMNAEARTEPNAFDRDAAKIAFQRPPLNRTPDVDPDPFTGNLRALTQLFWSGAR